MATKQMIQVNPEMATLLKEMNPQHVALLVLKILYPDKPLHELAKEVWPDVMGAMRRKRIHESRVTLAITSIAQNPYQLAAILASKLMPLALATLYEGMSAEKENVRVSAAKELIRFVQSTVSKLESGEPEPLPTEAGDEALEEAAIEVEFKEVEEDGDSELGGTDD